jgi:hypothetical protein
MLHAHSGLPLSILFFCIFSCASLGAIVFGKTVASDMISYRLINIQGEMENKRCIYDRQL